MHPPARSPHSGKPAPLVVAPHPRKFDATGLALAVSRDAYICTYLSLAPFPCHDVFSLYYSLLYP